MIYLGIDAGASGAVSLFDDLKLIEVFDIPFDTIGGNKIMDAGILEDELTDHVNLDRIDMIFIEQVGSRGGQGVKSMFSFGQRFGEVNTWALTFTRDLVFLTPQVWKANSGLIGMDKKASALKAAKLYPDQETKFVEPNKRCKDGNKYYDGRGDAVLIGLMGYKQHRRIV